VTGMALAMHSWNLDEEVRFAPALVEIARGG
jgi:hypothetical protein